MLDLPEQAAREQPAQVAAALRWLEGHPGWFLILDNVDTPEAAAAVERLLGRLSRGRVVVTSRLAQWGAGVEPLELDVLAEAPAVEFLLERTDTARRKGPTDAADALGLAQDVDCLALALEQAGAFVVAKRGRLSLADYRAQWQQGAERVRGWSNERLMKYPRSVAVTWDTSFGQLEPASRELLETLAWFAPEPIPLEVLDHLPGGPDALDGLTTYSLARLDDAGTAVKVHRLVQEVTRAQIHQHRSTRASALMGWLTQKLRLTKPLDPDSRLKAAIDGINAFLPNEWGDGRITPKWGPALLHVWELAQHSKERGMAGAADRLMAGLSFYSIKLMLDGNPGYDRFDYWAPPHDLETAVFQNNVARLLKEANRLAAAEPLARRSLVIIARSRHVTGQEHLYYQAAARNHRELLEALDRTKAEIDNELARIEVEAAG